MTTPNGTQVAAPNLTTAMQAVGVAPAANQPAATSAPAPAPTPAAAPVPRPPAAPNIFAPVASQAQQSTTGPQPAPQLQPQAPVAPAPTQVANTPVSPASPAVPAAPGVQEDPVIADFRNRGYEIPAGMTRDAFFNQISQQIDDANQIRDQYLPHKDKFTAWMEEQQKAAQPAATDTALPAQPAPGVSAESPGSEAGSFSLSETARSLKTQGLLKQGEGGVWTATDPGLQHYADEANRFDQHLRQRAERLLNEPDKVFDPYARKVATEVLSPLEERLQNLEAQLAEERRQIDDARVDQEIERESNHYFVNGDRTQLTTYGQQYNSFAHQIAQNAANIGQQLSRRQIRDQTLSLLRAAGIAPQLQPAPPAMPTPGGAQVAQPAAPQVTSTVTAPAAPQPQASFMQQAAATQPEIFHNRLSEYAAHQPSGMPQMNRPSNRLPSMREIIEQLPAQ